MAIRNKPLTAHDRQVVRSVAREMLEDYNQRGDYDGPQTVVLSSGYADVDIGHTRATSDHAFVIRNRVTTRVPLSSGPRKVGAKRKAGRKTSARKKVSSRKVANPSRKRKAARKALPKRRADGTFAPKKAR